MKISPRKKGQIYDLVHEVIRETRIELQRDYLPKNTPMANKVDFVVAQIEIPLANKIIKLLQGESKE